jgi:hypothetical protein
MATTLREQMSNAAWWAVAIGITAYLFLGVVNTLVVVLG